MMFGRVIQDFIEAETEDSFCLSALIEQRSLATDLKGTFLHSLALSLSNENHYRLDAKKRTIHLPSHSPLLCLSFHARPARVSILLPGHFGPSPHLGKSSCLCLSCRIVRSKPLPLGHRVYKALRRVARSYFPRSCWRRDSSQVKLGIFGTNHGAVHEVANLYSCGPY